MSPLKQAIVELRALRAERDALQRARHAPLAIVGLACRFPGGADDPTTYWRLLHDGVDAISEIPPDRWDVDAHYDPDPDAPGKHATRWGGFVAGVDGFDPTFFGITPREAVSMDPQQRLLLELSWEALEHAGQSPERLNGSATGVFVGIGTQDYAHLRLMYGAAADIDAYLATGSSHSIASGRLSYVLGLNGPSVSIDTACSSSLVAVHLAAQSLRSGECRMALAGGVNLILMPEMVVTLSKAHMMAADGRCKAFDARADGFVRGEGCGMVVLKRLDDARADGDRVLAILRGTAMNQDGRSNGLTAPNGPAQVAVIRAALADAGVDPGTVDYVETHGTGTVLGDPIEVEALGQAYGDRPADRPLSIGSVKTNIGHLEAAAGVAGLIKAVLALRRATIPPHLHLRAPNPLIDWRQWPVAIPTTPTPWPATEHPRRAAVSSFGFSGTNAHVILEAAEAQEPAPPADDRSPAIVCLSARTEPALRALAARYAARLDAQPDAAIADIAFTANTGRSHFEHRLAIIVGGSRSPTSGGTETPDRGAGSVDRGAGAGVAELRAKLAAWERGEFPAGLFQGRTDPDGRPPIAFLFTGQGAQYAGMGRGLYLAQPTFRDVMDQCAALLDPHLTAPLMDVMFAADGDGTDLDRTDYTQPALFALQAALTALWRSWGVEPAAVLGHSVGELAAAHAAGVLSLADGLALAAARGRLMQELASDGAMAVVFADVHRVAPFIAAYADAAAIAAVNGPENTVIAGRAAAVAGIVGQLAEAGVRVRPLKVALPAHTPLVEPILDAFGAAAAVLRFEAPTIPLVSGVTGMVADKSEVATADYWRRNLRAPVQFARAVSALAEQGCRAFVEIGPGSTLLGMGRRAWPAAVPAAAWMPSLRPDRADPEQMLDSLAALYTQGVAVDWVGVAGGTPRRRVTLPTYPWERSSYWLPEIRAARLAAPPDAAALWPAVASAGDHQAGQGPLDLDLAGHADRWASLDALAIAYIAAALRGWGVFDAPGAAVTVDGLLTEHGLGTGQRSVLTRWLRELAAEGMLETVAPDAYRPTTPAAWPDIAERLATARARFTDGPQLPDYVQRCGEALADALTGRRSPLELLFPGGRLDTADYLYHDCDVPRYCNAVAVAVVEAAVRAWPAGRPLRVVDIGAGTGGLAADLLPVLPADRAIYTFTDVSDFFFARAAERFSAYPFLRCARLDIEQAPEAQGFGRHGVDIAVAANVLHATRDIDAALAHLRSLLAPGGLLVLSETTRHPTWFDATIALIEGWSRHEGDERRRDHPLLTAEQWLAALDRAGFAPATAWPSAHSPAAVLGAHVLVAQTAADTVGVAESAGLDVPTWRDAVAPVAAGSTTAAVADAIDGQAGARLARWREAPPGERRAELIAFVREQVVRVARCDPARPPDRRQRLSDLGMDSLMAVELRDRLGVGLALDQPLPATLMFDYPTIEAIAGYLERQIIDGDAAAGAAEVAVAPGARPATRTADGIPTTEADVAELSDAEIEVLLQDRMREIATDDAVGNGGDQRGRR